MVWVYIRPRNEPGLVPMLFWVSVSMESVCCNDLKNIYKADLITISVKFYLRELTVGGL